MKDVGRVNLVKVIAATMFDQRQKLGETITAWLEQHTRCEILDIVITQSSDREYHCICCTIFAHDPEAAARTIGGARK